MNIGDFFKNIAESFKEYRLQSKESARSSNSAKRYGKRSDRNDGPNGEIDESIFQKSLGDCWLLAGVQSLSYTKEGKELIKSAISQNKEGDWEIYYKGLDKSYTVTQEELDKYNKKPSSMFSKYSTGDDDMLLMELSMEKLIQEEQDNKNVDKYILDGIDGACEIDFFKLFCGEDAEETTTKKFFENDLEIPRDSALTYALDPDAKSDKLMKGHAYTIKSFNERKGIVKLVNPWDTTREITMNMDNLPDGYITSSKGFLDN